MKKLKVSAQIIRCSPVTGANGTPLIRNGRLITHRLILAFSQSFEIAIKACKELPRLTAEAIQALEKENPGKTYTDREAAFCLKRDDGQYAIDLNQDQMNLLTGGRMTPQQFQFVAPHTTFSAVIALRNVGDKAINNRTKAEVEIKQAHAAIVDLSSTVNSVVESNILHAMFSSPAPVVNLSTPQSALPTTDNMEDLDIPASNPTSKIQIGATEEEEEFEVGGTQAKKGK